MCMCNLISLLEAYRAVQDQMREMLQTQEEEQQKAEVKGFLGDKISDRSGGGV